MPDTSSRRSRPVIDNLVLIAVLLCASIAVVRFALVVATVPYAAYVSQRETARAEAGGVPAPDTRITERITSSGPFLSWWGERRVPYREGGDYFGVISRHAVVRSLGCVIGVIAEELRTSGAPIDRVIVPSDRVALYGAESGTLMVRADGTEYRSEWGPVSNASAFFTDIPVVEQPYDPVLTANKLARLEQYAGLTKRSRDFYVGALRTGGSGTWIIYVREGTVREFLMVPIESLPNGGAL